MIFFQSFSTWLSKIVQDFCEKGAALKQSKREALLSRSKHCVFYYGRTNRGGEKSWFRNRGKFSSLSCLRKKNNRENDTVDIVVAPPKQNEVAFLTADPLAPT